LPLDAVTKEPSNSCKGRAVDISPNGKLCAVGFRDGSVRLFNTTGWKQMKTISHAKKLLIQDLKFSPNGQYLAVSSHDMLVYIYDVANFDKKPVVCKGSTSAVTHIDWSTDSKWIHSNDLSYELLFYSATTGEQDRAGSRTKKDEEWATWSLP
jgi:microtubule-associated protein-like 6